MYRPYLHQLLAKLSTIVQNSNVFEMGLSDFHKLATTVLKAVFSQAETKSSKLQGLSKIR